MSHKKVMGSFRWIPTQNLFLFQPSDGSKDFPITKSYNGTECRVFSQNTQTRALVAGRLRMTSSHGTVKLTVSHTVKGGLPSDLDIRRAVKEVEGLVFEIEKQDSGYLLFRKEVHLQPVFVSNEIAESAHHAAALVLEHGSEVCDDVGPTRFLRSYVLEVESNDPYLIGSKHMLQYDDDSCLIERQEAEEISRTMDTSAPDEKVLNAEMRRVQAGADAERGEVEEDIEETRKLTADDPYKNQEPGSQSPLFDDVNSLGGQVGIDSQEV